MNTDLLYMWTASPVLSVAIWLVIAMTVLYLGRPQAHQLLRSTGRALYGTLRLAARSVRNLEQRVAQRNKDVLLASGREACEKAIEREFTRVNAVVERDLSQYPNLHRQLSDSLQKMEEAFHASSHEAPLPPAWSDVMDTIATLPTTGDPQVVKILKNIQSVMENSHQQTLKAVEKNATERHKILASMQPDIRALNHTMGKVEQKVSGLAASGKAIDRHMEQYESLRKGEDKAVHSLTASSLTQFFIATLVLVIAAFGGVINFHLIALPMSEMVGGASYIGGVRTSDIAALVIIMVEIAMGIFLLEALQVTRLFPMIGTIDDRMRKRMAVAAFSILFIFAAIESSLAYMRDLLALDREALQQSLAGSAVAEAQFRWIPSIGQMVLGFVLPFALAFVAIPLESFIHSLRTLIGVVVLGALCTLLLVLHLTGTAANHLSKMLIHLYDIFVMLPLAVEQRLSNGLSARKAAKADGKEVKKAKKTEQAKTRDDQPSPATTAKEPHAEPEAPARPTRKRAARTSPDTSTLNPSEA